MMCVDAHYLDIYGDQLTWALEQGFEGDAAEDVARERAEPLYLAWVERSRSVIGLRPSVEAMKALANRTVPPPIDGEQRP